MDDQLTDQELVAFLDGEITQTERATIEQRIANEPELGQRLADLRTTWQLLDHLPPTEPTDDFTKTTVTMTAIRSGRSALSRFMRRQWITLAGVFIGLAAGYSAVFLPMQYEQQKRLRDVPVIDNVDLYLHAESIEFLRQLDSEELFAQDLDLDEELDNVL